MFGKTVCDIAGRAVRARPRRGQASQGCTGDLDLDADDLEELVDAYKKIFGEHTGRGLPAGPARAARPGDPRGLRRRGTPTGRCSTAARSASRPTSAPRSTSWRWSSATSARTPAPGWRSPATRPPARRASTATTWPTPRARTSSPASATPCRCRSWSRSTRQSYDELLEIMARLEEHYRDLCDIEFTIERGKLWMLQTRVGKRTAAAAFRIATQLVDEGLIDLDEALRRVTGAQLAQLMFPQFDPSRSRAAARPGAWPPRRARPSARRSSTPTPRSKWPVGGAGHPGPPGDQPGRPARHDRRAGHPHQPRAARPPTPPWSPAAWARPASAAPRSSTSTPSAAGSPRRTAPSCTRATSSPSTAPTGAVYAGRGAGHGLAGGASTSRAPSTAAAPRPTSWCRAVHRLMTHADAVRRLRVRANADTAEDAERARRFGAEGIGLCRTEHMFLGERRQHVERLILAEDDERARPGAGGAAAAAARGLRADPHARWTGCRSPIRLLDPPLHEFLPDITELSVRVALAEARGEEPTRTTCGSAGRPAAARAEPDARAARRPAGPGHPRPVRHAGPGDRRGRRPADASWADPQPEIMVPLVGVGAGAGDRSRPRPRRCWPRSPSETGVELTRRSAR